LKVTIGSGIFKAIGVVGSLAVVSVMASNVWAVLNLSLIPPGRLSAMNLIALREFLGGTLSFEAIRPSILLTAFLQNMGFDQLTSLKLGSTIFFAILGLAVALTAFIITNNYIAAIFSGFLAGLFPVFFQPIFAGDYGLVSAIALTQLSLVFILKFIHDGGRFWFGAGILSLVFSSLSDPTAPIFTSVVLVAWFFYALYRRHPRYTGLLALVAFGIGLTVVLLPFNLESQAAAARGTLWVSKIFADSAMLVLLGLASIAGGITLFLRDKWQSVAPLLWVLIPIGLAISFKLDFLLYAIPPLIVISSASLIHLRDFFKMTIKKGSRKQDQGKEDSIVFEFKLEQSLALVLIALLAISSLATLPSMERIQEENALSDDELLIINSVASLSGVFDESGIVLAPGQISPWLKALAGINTIVALTDQEIESADAALSTAFRIRNKYLMIDEWQPFNSNRSPFIYSFDENIYSRILHMDDRLIKLRLMKSGETRIDNFYGMAFKSYRWDEDLKEIRLSLSFEKKDFSLTKTLTLDKEGATIDISYNIIPGEGVELVDLSVPLFIEGRQQISHKVTNEYIDLNMRHVNLRVEYGSANSIELVRVPEANKQDHVLANFSQIDGSIIASTKVTILNPSSSGQKSFYSSFFDINNKNKIDYILGPSNLGDLNLYRDLLGPIPMLEINDAFSKVSLAIQGTSFIESPYRAEVIREDFDDTTRNILYKTSGLFIEKRIKISNNVLTLASDH